MSNMETLNLDIDKIVTEEQLKTRCEQLALIEEGPITRYFSDFVLDDGGKRAMEKKARKKLLDGLADGRYDYEIVVESFDRKMAKDGRRYCIISAFIRSDAFRPSEIRTWLNLRQVPKDTYIGGLHDFLNEYEKRLQDKWFETQRAVMKNNEEI